MRRDIDVQQNSQIKNRQRTSIVHRIADLRNRFAERVQNKRSS